MLVVSPLLLEELEAVLLRPKLARWAAHGRAQAYVAALRARSEHRADPADHRSAEVRDPNDAYLVSLAIDANADVLVSLDRDLLDAQLAGIAVLDPAVFVGSLPGAGELFFAGTTRAGRELRLYYEHTAYEDFTDETGKLIRNPTETQITEDVPGGVEVW